MDYSPWGCKESDTWATFTFTLGFPDSSVGKESACNEGDPGSIPESGRSTGEARGYPLQYTWASLVAQWVKNRPQCRRPGFDPWVGRIPWRRERLPTPVFWPGEFHGLYIVHGVTKSPMELNNFHITSNRLSKYLKQKLTELKGGINSSTGEGNGTPHQYSCLENPMDGGAWWAAVHGVAKSRTRLSDFTFIFLFHFSLSCTGEGNDNPLQCSCLENPRDGGAWWAAIFGVAQSRTRLKWLSSLAAGL